MLLSVIGRMLVFRVAPITLGSLLFRARLGIVKQGLDAILDGAGFGTAARGAFTTRCHSLPILGSCSFHSSLLLLEASLL
jgi:hypothetical protein